MTDNRAGSYTWHGVLWLRHVVGVSEGVLGPALGHLWIYDSVAVSSAGNHRPVGSVVRRRAPRELVQPVHVAVLPDLRLPKHERRTEGAKDVLGRVYSLI